MFGRLAAVCLILALVTACTAPPEPERHQAEGAIAAARAAGAAVYAPDALETAERALAQYDAAVADRDYRQALRLAIEARDGAYTAARLAADRKADARSAAERLATDVAARLEDVQGRLAALPASRSHSAAADTLRALQQSGSEALQEARTAIGDGEFRSAIDRLEPVLQELQEERDRRSSSRGR